MAHTDSSQPHSHIKELALTFAALIVLTIVTVKVAKLDFGGVAINISIALLIASLKAGLVALYFMHLKWEEKLIVGFAVLSVPFVILMIATMVWDVSQKTAELIYAK